jgi:hypothetical protein
VAIADRSTASPDGQLNLAVLRNGVEVDALVATADGVLVGAPDGLQQGYGTINCQGVFVNGTAVGGVVPDATTSVKGIVRLASPGETAARVLSNVAVVPSSIPSASTTQPGWIELATQAEANAGTDTTRALTPSHIIDAATALLPATTGSPGLIEIATLSEANAGVAASVAVTPSSLPTAIAALAPVASQFVRGMVRTTLLAEFTSGSEASANLVPSMANFNTLKDLTGNNGFYVLPSGLQFVWGAASIPSAAPLTVTFERAFAITPFFAVASADTAFSIFATVADLTATTMSVRRWSVTFDNMQAGGVIYFALGVAS